MIALLVFFFAIYIPDRCRQDFLHDYLLADFETDTLSSQYMANAYGFTARRRWV
jgi:hypothetical protein